MKLELRRAINDGMVIEANLTMQILKGAATLTMKPEPQAKKQMN